MQTQPSPSNSNLPKLTGRYALPHCMTCGIDLPGTSASSHGHQHALMQQAWELRDIYGVEHIVEPPFAARDHETVR